MIRATRNILIVEDERVVARDLQRSLADLGYDVPATAATAEQALALATQHCPDLVLMDIRIKGDRDGIETAELLRGRFDVPIVYLTAYADDETLERAKKTQPLGYLLKPVKPNELRSTVEIALHKHQLDKRLRERERWFSTTLSSIDDAVITVDADGRVSFMNPKAEQLTGVKEPDALGRPAREIVLLRQVAECRSPLDEALEQRRSISIDEATLVNSAIPNRIVSDSAAPVVDRGTMLGAVMVFRDVTDKKTIQLQLALADRLASLGTMAAGVAHEVNNPLAIILTNATYVRDELTRALEAGGPSGDARRLSEALQAQTEIESAARRIAHIVADLKRFVRPPSGEPGRADVRRAIEWAVRSTEHQLRFRARVVTRLVDVPKVAMEETSLSQILVNLLINASHAITPGLAHQHEVTVATALFGDGRVAIEVRDTGSGMSPEVIRRIFEPFFTTKPVGLGTGLGLSICHGLVSASGGEIQVDSHVGQGTLFRVLLPTAEAERASVPSPPGAGVGERRGRVLVIDDEELVLKAVRRGLEAQDVTCTTSAREALRLLDGGASFDLILCDLMMPDMTGPDFYEALLASRPQTARLVVFLSGGTITSDGADFLAAVSNARLEKPFELATLRELVRKRLQGA